MQTMIFLMASCARSSASSIASSEASLAPPESPVESTARMATVSPSIRASRACVRSPPGSVAIAASCPETVALMSSGCASDHGAPSLAGAVISTCG